MVLEKQDFFAVDRFSMFFWLLFAVESGNGKVQEMRVGALHFSPDSKYLLFGKTNFTFAVVSATGAKVNLPNSIKEIMKGAFSFLDGDRVIGVAGSKGEHGAALKFPTGEPVYSNLRMGMVYIEGASKGEYALLSPFNEYALGVFDLKANKFLIGSKKPSADIYNDEYLFERVDGELANYDLVGKKELNKVELHESPLGRITATAASEDLNYVAISGTVRGAVWNLAKGARVSHLRRFDSATVDDSGFTIADFPPEGEGGRRQFGLIDTAKNSATTVEAEENVKYLQAGPYLVLRSPEKKQDWRKNVTFEVKDLKSNKSLWERKFPNGTPAFHVAPEVDSVVFVYDVNDVDGKAVLQSNEELRGKVQALKTREHAYVIETLDAKTGKVVGLTAIDTGKGAFHLRDAFRAGQSLVISDTRDRVQVFGFDGTRKGRLQSYGATASRDGKLMAALVGRGKLVIYDLEKFHRVDELDFSSELALLRFSNGGDRLLVVTRDQKAYYFDTKQLLGSSQVAAK
jgi:hypothetical protein